MTIRLQEKNGMHEREPVDTGLEGSATIHDFSMEQYQMIKSELTRQA